uniref:U3 small nucleolar ribonucleoprotein protein MPP10 n=1 Tax=Parastrongyloides trichosuri TaxID=131310 RepID=A0A0N4Z9Z3_PARTI
MNQSLGTPSRKKKSISREATPIRRSSRLRSVSEDRFDIPEDATGSVFIMNSIAEDGTCMVTPTKKSPPKSKKQVTPKVCEEVIDNKSETIEKFIEISSKVFNGKDNFISKYAKKLIKSTQNVEVPNTMSFLNDLYNGKEKTLENANFKSLLNLSYNDMTKIDGDKSLPENIISDNVESISAQYKLKMDMFSKFITDQKKDLAGRFGDLNLDNNVKEEKIFEDDEIDELDYDSDEGINDHIEDEEEFDEDEEEMIDEEEECEDLFGLTDKDVENLDEELDALAAESDEDSDVEKKPKKVYKKKTPIDDDFFNLEEMNDFLMEAEKEKDSEGFFDDIDEGDDEAAEYCYKDFFEENVKKKNKTHKVRFEDEVKEQEIEDDDEEMEIDEPILLGEKQKEEVKSSFEKRQEDIKKKIKRLEEENLAPKSWELSGEVTADDREKDSMLATHAAFDYVSKQAPTITPDHTERLEALIIQRIKDKVFDDPVRKTKKDETVKVFRENAIEEIQRKSLVEVYEEQFKKARGDKEDNSEIDKETLEVEKEMNELFSNLDGLYHFDFKPTEIVPDLQIITNMPAMRKEEVGPLAIAQPDEATVFAPEETGKKLKGDLKSKDERDTTDKLRERRKKKKKQKVLASKGVIKPSEKKNKDLKRKADGVGSNKEEIKKLKGSKFFESLQKSTQEEIRRKAAEKP